MNDEPAKEPKKDHFYEAIKGPGQAPAGPRFPGNPKFSHGPMPSGPGGRQAPVRNFGGASGRHGGKSR
jgi:hypothetical protein